jgi:ethanolamine utilization microcompartment shell protein EutS
MDCDNSLNIVLGGYSSDIALVNSNNPTSFIQLIDNTGLTIWMKQYFQTSISGVAALTFNPSATRILAAFKSTSINLAIIDSASGAVLNYYYSTGVGSQIFQPNSIILTDSLNMYVGG